MSKNIILLSVATLITFGGIYLIATKSGLIDRQPTSSGTSSESNRISQTGSEENEDTRNASNFSGISTFFELANRGDRLRCEYSTLSLEDGTETSGVIYLADGKMRVESEIMQDDDIYMVSFIDDSEYMYTWTSGIEGSMAIKIAKEDTDYLVADNTEYESGLSGASEEPFDYQEEVTYDCHVWSVDNSIFVPPVDIDFINPNSMFESLGINPEMLEQMMAQ